MDATHSQYEIAVIGAGASGMVAAIFAARTHTSVCLIESNSRVGRKILETGNGRCNLSHTSIDGTEYRGGGADRIGAYLERFGVSETIDFFKSIGLLTRERDGYIYPYSETASAVLDVLRFAVEEAGVDVYTDRKLRRIMRCGDCFELDGIRAKRVILCAGGSADPASGSDGSGMGIARDLGLKIIEPLPALVKVRTSDQKSTSITAGVRAKGNVSVLIDGKHIASDTGEIQFTKDGLSGIPVFNVSRYISRAIADGHRVGMILDLMPEMSLSDITEYLSTLMEKQNVRTQNIEEVLSGILHKKLNACICKRMGISPGASSSELTPELIAQYASLVKALGYEIDSVYGFEQAQVTCGGVDFSEVDDNLQSIRIPGLYLAGEILDIDGPCGGYNLQWAWTSGYIAGISASTEN